MTDESTLEWMALQSDEYINALLHRLDDADLRAAAHDWSVQGRKLQKPPPGDWAIWLMLAGRGFGKTRAGAEWVRAIAQADGASRIALVGASVHEARSVMVEGASGLLSILSPFEPRPDWRPALRRLT